MPFWTNNESGRRCLKLWLLYSSYAFVCEWWTKNVDFRVNCRFNDSITHLFKAVTLILTSSRTTTITTVTSTQLRTRRTAGQSGFLMVALSELMRAAASAGRINIISSILWLPVAYLWPGFCALRANNASKKQRSGSPLPHCATATPEPHQTLGSGPRSW